MFKAPNRQHPFVLLQPRPRLEDILPNANLQAAAREKRLDVDTAYVGLVEATGSLYAMGPDRYPLIVFGDSQYGHGYYGIGHTISASPDADSESERDLPADVDSVTRRARARKLREMCKEGSTDRRCMTGIRSLESSSRSRLSRLLDAAPSLPYSPSYNSNTPDTGIQHDDRDHPTLPPASEDISVPQPSEWQRDNRPTLDFPFGFDVSSLVPLLFSLLGTVFLIGFIWGFSGKRSKRNREPRPNELTPPSITETSNSESLVPSTSQAVVDIVHDFVPPSPLPSKQDLIASDGDVPSNPLFHGADLADDAVDADDSDRDGDTPATPGKRKGFRRKRGKKKKGGAANGAAQDVETEKEADTGRPADENGDAQTHAVPDQLDVAPPLAIVMSAPSTPVPIPSSLLVSDTVLGKRALAVYTRLRSDRFCRNTKRV